MAHVKANHSPRVTVAAQRWAGITSVLTLCIMWHFRSLIAFLSLHSSSAPSLCEVWSGIRLGTASIHHNISISKLLLANSTIRYFDPWPCPTCSGWSRTARRLCPVIHPWRSWYYSLQDYSVILFQMHFIRHTVHLATVPPCQWTIWEADQGVLIMCANFSKLGVMQRYIRLVTAVSCYSL